MAKAIHFEIPADDPERAVRFYTQALGWKFDKWGGPADYWLAMAGPEDEAGINGAIMRRQERTTVTNTMGVASLAEAMEAVGKAGGTVLTPRMAVPGVGYMAYCADTEGNVFGIMQSDPEAR